MKPRAQPWATAEHGVGAEPLLTIRRTSAGLSASDEDVANLGGTDRRL